MSALFDSSPEKIIFDLVLLDILDAHNFRLGLIGNALPNGEHTFSKKSS